MRLDLFLKASRLVKRRTVAQELCDEARVDVNGRAAKPGKDVGPGDVITIRFATRILAVEVLPSAEGARKAPPESLYTLRSSARAPQERNPWNENP